MDLRIGQKIKSTLTGREYEVKKMLKKGSIQLESEDGKACAVIHEDKLEWFFEKKECQDTQ